MFLFRIYIFFICLFILCRLVLSTLFKRLIWRWKRFRMVSAQECAYF